jgi:hypothetical protein
VGALQHCLADCAFTPAVITKRAKKSKYDLFIVWKIVFAKLVAAANFHKGKGEFLSALFK